MKQQQTPEQGREYIAPTEASDTQDIIDAIKKRLERDFPPGKTLRQFHAKMHGCVKATFTVLPDIPINFQHGFLIPAKQYDCWIRFSNGRSSVVDDRKADLRGMAIKLLNVPGEMLMQDHSMPQSQDFLLVSYPTLMSASVADFKKNIYAICNGFLGAVKFGINPANWPAVIRTVQSMKKCDSVLSLTYYSVSPYRLGAQEQAVKYAAIPARRSSLQKVDKDTNFLRKQMQSELSQHSVSFDFMLQLQEDPKKEPIENPCVEWKSRWQKVATIEIPPQQFDTPERNSFAESLTYSPWHSLKEHQPLGGVNRARRAVYEAISQFRLQRNKQ